MIRMEDNNWYRQITEDTTEDNRSESEIVLTKDIRSLCEKVSMTAKSDMQNGAEVGQYVCGICYKHFKIAQGVRRHMLIHTGEKPYTCNSCSKQFAQASNLKQHMLVHTGDKPYTCDVCLKQFTSECHLKKHILIHTGEKSHTCDVFQTVYTGRRSQETFVDPYWRETSFLW